ncbi:DUF421 domain-containing protein [Agrilutibacter solisilvae]|uniref:DUF421 domain-containing protein n=1 Tax=Agrilutibacter solisilvae TaxID=2763317 RepID=A0A974Y1N4_9GAMM|nr:YetF domain-containing protein [Lysobacter solisilvae]QSX78903.1 DUF421 domain-containing protein [Lysobacter solisilvae]
MESVFRGVTVYVFLWLIFRISGKRTLAQTTPFELVLLLIISEVTNQAMVDSDHSVTNAFLLIMTLTGMSVLLSIVKHRSPRVSRWLDGLPLPLVRDGKLLKENMDKARVDEEEILMSARFTQGIDSMGAIKDATLENDGKISVVPRRSS